MGRIFFCRKQFRIIDLRHIVTWGRLSRIYSYIFLDTICRISYRTLIGSYLGPMHLTLDVSRWHIVSGHIVLGKIVRCYIVWQIFQNINTVWDQHLKMSAKWIPDIINFFIQINSLKMIILTKYYLGATCFSLLKTIFQRRNV